MRRSGDERDRLVRLSHADRLVTGITALPRTPFSIKGRLDGSRDMQECDQGGGGGEMGVGKRCGGLAERWVKGPNAYLLYSHQD